MIVDKKKGRGPRRGRGRGAATGATASAGATARARYSGILPSSNATVTTRQAAAAASVQASAVASEKIIVSNLPPDVSEPQIKVCLCLVSHLYAVGVIFSRSLMTQIVGSTPERRFRCFG